MTKSTFRQRRRLTHNRSKILLIDDDASMADACREALARRGYEVELANSGPKGLALLQRWAYDLILLDLRMPGMDGLSTLERIREQDPEAVVVILTAHGSIESAVQSMKLGAYDFLLKPFTPAELRRAVRSALEKRRLLRENTYLREELARSFSLEDVVTTSSALKEVLALLEKVAPTDATVLLTGESGTGKGLLARLLHQLSGRNEHPFVSVDCSTLVPTLFESELFGHVRGAYTGAESDKVGKFEVAHGGTLFLDEVANISLDIQAKLLKAVEERAITRVGSNRVIHVDARMVAATNQDLPQAVQQGTFRQDLYYRLNVVHIFVPPLRERPEDVPPLAQHFLEAFRQEYKLNLKGLTPRALDTLMRQPWPGNVRELENTVQRLAILAPGPMIDLPDLEAFCPPCPPPGQQPPLDLAEAERHHILSTLKRLGGHRSETARVLGIDRKTLRNKLNKYQQQGYLVL